MWAYNYLDEVDGKRKSLFSISLPKLEEKVKSKGLRWEIIDEELAKQTIEEDKNVKVEYDKPYVHSLKTTTTGIFHLTKRDCPSCDQGFIWGYKWIENGKKKTMSSVSLTKLKEKVLRKGLPWKIIDEELAKKHFKKIKNSIFIKSDQPEIFYKPDHFLCIGFHYNQLHGYILQTHHNPNFE